MERAAFGILPDGAPVELFTLGDRRGLEVRITNYGGIITHLLVPDKNGARGDVLLGFDSLEPYLGPHPYLGALIGRVAGRVPGGAFELDGGRHTLVINDPPNHLHGGSRGFDKRLWRAEPVAHAGGDALRLNYLSGDGEEGYPGNLSIAVTYTVDVGGELRIDYEATTDRATPLCLTSHGYFNLAGESSGDIRAHELQIFADDYTPTDFKLTPLAVRASVADLPCDFRRSAAIGERLEKLHRNHGDNYLVRRIDNTLTLAARVFEPTSGRLMEVLTTEPCVQFYTGHFLDGSLVGKSGRAYGSYAGLCLECQRYPAALGRRELGPLVLRPGETYRQTTLYRFTA